MGSATLSVIATISTQPHTTVTGPPYWKPAGMGEGGTHAHCCELQKLKHELHGRGARYPQQRGQAAGAALMGAAVMDAGKVSRHPQVASTPRHLRLTNVVEATEAWEWEGRAAPGRNQLL